MAIAEGPGDVRKPLEGSQIFRRMVGTQMLVPGRCACNAMQCHAMLAYLMMMRTEESVVVVRDCSLMT